MTVEFPDNPRFVQARATILAAGRLASRHFAHLGDLAVEEKLNGQDVVSLADRAVEALIRGDIAAAFPEDFLLGEETGLGAGAEADRDASDYLWVVDPIDGTSCFLHGLPDWCISIALVRDEEVELGLILHPASGELFVAARGRGAFLNGRPVHVDMSGTLGSGLVGLGANFRVPTAPSIGFAKALLDRGGMFYRNGSGALMLTYVACGRLTAYYEPHINAWDCLAAFCLIREAGGWTVDFPTGADILKGGVVIAAAPQLRDDILSLVAIAQTSDR